MLMTQLPEAARPKFHSPPVQVRPGLCGWTASGWRTFPGKVQPGLCAREGRWKETALDTRPESGFIFLSHCLTNQLASYTPLEITS